MKMVSNLVIVVLVTIVFGDLFVFGCLITNCPRGGKRSGKLENLEPNIKPCISCGPGHTGQCFGPNICCGPFGCLMGTSDTVRCQREGFFQEREPCVAGNGFCRKNMGRCAMDGICCNQDSCFTDKHCSFDDKKIAEGFVNMELYSLMNYPTDLASEK